MATLLEQLKTLVAPTVEALGYELWGLQYQPHGGRSILRVFIEAPEGVTVDDCAKVSRQIGSVLDAEAPIRSAYTLEVSSPGMDRLLFEIEHYQRYLGQEIRIKLMEPLEERRTWVGKIIDAEEGVIKLDVLGQVYCLPLAKIQTAQVVIHPPVAKALPGKSKKK